MFEKLKLILTKYPAVFDLNRIEYSDKIRNSDLCFKIKIVDMGMKTMFR